MISNGPINKPRGGVAQAASRTAAIALLLAVGFVGYATAISPWSDVIKDYDDRLVQTAEMVQRYRQIGANRGPLADRLADVQKREPAAGFLTGDSASLIAANLQNRVKQVVQAHGATIYSVEILSSKADAAFQKVSIRVQLRGDITAIQGIFYAFETAPSYLTIDNLDLRSNAPRRVQRNRKLPVPNRRLVASFDLGGYMWNKKP